MYQKLGKEKRPVNESVFVRTIAITGPLEGFTRIYGFEEQNRDNDIKFCSKTHCTKNEVFH